jgi:hypothetical protein
MRGSFQDRTGLFSYISLEERVPEKHPLRSIRKLVRLVYRAGFDGILTVAEVSLKFLLYTLVV